MADSVKDEIWAWKGIRGEKRREPYFPCHFLHGVKRKEQ